MWFSNFHNFRFLNEGIGIPFLDMSPHLEGTQQIGLLLLLDGMGVGCDVPLDIHTLTTSECERLCFCVYWKYGFIPITSLQQGVRMRSVL